MARNLYTNLDLNLLKTFLVLGEEQNMRRAADRLFVTQPAVSQSLKKLRHHFDDELFIRTPKGLSPTAYAERLMASVAPILDDLSVALNDQARFDPAELTGDLRVALAPHLASYLSAPLFRTIHESAPGVRIHLTNWNETSLDDLAKGELDLGVSMDIPVTTKLVMRELLVDDYFRCYVREGHPLADLGEELALRHLDGQEMAILVVPDWNPKTSHAERIVKANGYSVSVGFRSDLPRAITDVVRQTDMVYPASSFVDVRDLKGLSSFRVKLQNRFLTQPVHSFFHQKNRRSPLNRWLRSGVRKLLDSA